MKMGIKISEIGKNICDTAQQEYKNNYKKTNNFENFLSLCPTIDNLIKTNSLLLVQIQKAFLEHHALQPAIIGECVAVNALANYYNFTYQSKPQNCRGYYQNNKNEQLFYYGDPAHNDIDIKFIDKIKHGEIKSHCSLAGDNDLTPYTEQGTTFPRPNTIWDTKEGRIIIEEFNNKNKNWALLGKNFKLNQYPDCCKQISKNYFKNIDFCIIIYPKQIVLFEVNDDFFNLINYEGSEIRTTGKNNKALQHTSLLNNWIKEYNPIVNGDIITIPLTKVEAVRGRGKTEISRYKLKMYTLLVMAKDCIINDDTITFNKRAVKIATPSGAVHIAFREE